MDRDGWDENTDVIVLVDAEIKQLLWVPRDLWCYEINDRINRAFALGGHSLLLESLSSFGIRAEHSVCFQRRSTEQALREATVTVPVSKSIRLWYPLQPRARIQDGRKPVDFDPPSANLTGERMHQWVGARYSRATPPPAFPDLDRIRRQQIFVRTLLDQGFDFRRALVDTTAFSASNAEAFKELGQVSSDWSFAGLDRVRPVRIEGKDVLLLADTTEGDKRAKRSLLRREWRRIRRRLQERLIPKS